MAMTGWDGWAPQERAVLTFVQEGTNLLLIHKKRGLGIGKVNAPGGRVEPGETWEQAAARETREETGLTPGLLEYRADLRFRFTDGYSLWARVFLGKDATGTLTSCDEADPFWHPAGSLPWDRMWADDALWVPPVLAGRAVDARFIFQGDTMVEAKIHILSRPTGPIAG